MEIRDVASIALKRWLVVLAVTVAALAIGAALAFTQPKRYEARVTMVLEASPARGTGFVPADTMSTLLGSYAAIIESRSNLRAAETKLGHPLPGTVQASTDASSGVLHVTGKAGTPARALETARSAAEAFRARVNRPNAVLELDTVDNGALPTSPVQPRPALIIPLAGILGLVAGVLLALFLEHFRRRIETVEDLARLTAAPVLALIPRERRLARTDPCLVWDDARLHDVQESIRSLRTNLLLVLESHRRSIQITSPVPGEGKSMIAANLAVSLSQLGMPTIVVDADISNPSQGRVFGLSETWGVNTLLAAPDSQIHDLATAYEHLLVIPAGPPVAGASDRLHVGFAALLRRLQSSGAVVIVDSPPLLSVSDARVISRTVDDVVLVVTAGRERPSSLAGALESLVLANANLIGLVLNQAVGAPAPSAPYYGVEREAERESSLHVLTSSDG